MLSTKADVRPLAVEVDKPLTAEPKIALSLSGVQTWTLTVVVSVVVSVVVVVVVSVLVSVESVANTSFVKFVLPESPVNVYSVSAFNEYALPDVNSSVPLIKSPLLLKVAVNVQSCATLNLIVFSILNCTYVLDTFLRL